MFQLQELDDIPKGVPLQPKHVVAQMHETPEEEEGFQELERR
jgi:hypothetical protein